MALIKATVLTLGLLSSGLVMAERELTVYGGGQTTPHSNVHVTDAAGSSTFPTSWQGKSLQMPPYYGLRYTAWLNEDWGYAINFTHAKAKANPVERDIGGYSVLEFTDGANPLTLVSMRRFETIAGFRPHAGLGLGVSFPHVEVEKLGGVKTFGYQYGGPVLTALGGASYDLNERWRLVTEFQFHYLKLDVRVDGGRLKTNLITNAINIGASYRF